MNMDDFEKNFKDMDWSKFGENPEQLQKMKE